MKRNQLWAPVALAFLAACSGGSATGSGETRDVTGTVPAGNNLALVQAQTASSNCRADAILATDTSDDTTSFDVADDCSFSITLGVDKAYILSFVKNDEFVASLEFDTGVSGFGGNTLPIFAGGGVIDLGAITFTGTLASAEHEPLDQIDTDGDGIADRLDDDDDNDGIEDWDENDCDLDGCRDDYDDDSECDPGIRAGQGSGRIIEVRPGRGNGRVNLNEEIRARIACRVDIDSLTAETFSVVDSDGNAVDCNYQVSDRTPVTSRAECEPVSDLSAETTYTVTLNGILCEDSTEVESRTWTFTTRDPHSGGDDDDHGGDDDEHSEDD